MLFEVAKGKAGLQEALTHLCKMAEESVTEGVNYIVLTDREWILPMLPFHHCWQ